MRIRGLNSLALGHSLLVALATGVFGGLPRVEAAVNKDIPVKITLLNAPGDRIRSDGKGIYTDGVDKVTAAIHANGKLDVFSGSHTKADKRHLLFDFGDVVLDSGCNRPNDPPGVAGIELPLNCDLAPEPWLTLGWARLHSFDDLNLLTMGAGTSAWGGFAIAFWDGCADWHIAFQNDGTEWEYSCGHTCSAQVKVEALDSDNNPRTGIPGTGVDAWRISAEFPALGSPQSEARACLWSGVTGVNSVAVLREIMRMPFQLLVELK